MSPLFSRLSAVSLAAATAALLVFGAVAPLAGHITDRRAEIADLRSQLARFEAAIQGGLSAERVTIVDAALLTGDSEGLAAAGLQALLNDLIAEAGAEMRSIRIEDGEPLDDAVMIPVSAELTADLAGVHRLLHGVESGSPYLFVDRLNARRTRGGDAGEPISVRLRVYGLAQARDEGAAADGGR
ncbi:MAG: type II secretion system protein GspM [Caulobacterales bacterium]|nr:type II secretion system protein GspM [Caulobacterales bacterium]